jgi:hypothetical protein
MKAMLAPLAALLCAGMLAAAEAAATDGAREARVPEEPLAPGDRDLDAALAAHMAEVRALQRSVHWPAPAIRAGELARTLARAFGPDAALLVYRFEGGGALLRVWLLRPGAAPVAATCTHTARDVADMLGRLHGGLAVKLPGARGEVAFRGGEALDGVTRPAPDPRRAAAASAELAACLFPGEIARALDGVRRLVVIPTRFLGIVPFSLLAPGNRAPLVETTSISIAPSAAAIAPLADVEDRGAPLDALVVGDPVTAPGGALPAARAEAETVAGAWGVRPVLGSAATVEEVKRRAADADVVYLATHGSVIPAFQVGRGSGDAIILADGSWSAWDLTYARLRARLAILSACDSALGLPTAAGVTGVARAFHQAGVPRVVASLWRVSDPATAELMVELAKGLADQEPAEALRLAMLRLRERRPDPAHWGAFTVFGSPRAGFESIAAGSAQEISAACRDGGCVVAFTPRAGQVRALCSGRRACADVYAGPGPGQAGTLWLARLADAGRRTTARDAAEWTGRAGLTLALVEALSLGPAKVYRRRVEP